MPGEDEAQTPNFGSQDPADPGDRIARRLPLVPIWNSTRVPGFWDRVISKGLYVLSPDLRGAFDTEMEEIVHNYPKCRPEVRVSTSLA
jgi:hypothetical protein